MWLSRWGTQFPDARIIILTTFDCGAEIKAALAGGGRSYMVKAMAPMEMQEISLKAQAAERAGTLAISS